MKTEKEFFARLEELRGQLERPFGRVRIAKNLGSLHEANEEGNRLLRGLIKELSIARNPADLNATRPELSERCDEAYWNLYEEFNSAVKERWAEV